MNQTKFRIRKGYVIVINMDESSFFSCLIAYIKLKRHWKQLEYFKKKGYLKMID